MRERLIEMIKQVYKICHDTPHCTKCDYAGKGVECFQHHIADHLLANGVIVPPCKVGDVLYDTYDCENIREIKVTEINIRLDKRNKPWIILGGYYYAFSDLGDTLFLTREEAEKGGAEE